MSRDLQLTGRKAFVSGSTKGIGLAIATLLAAEGAQVVINGRSNESVATALEQIKRKAHQPKADGFFGDQRRGFACGWWGGEVLFLRDAIRVVSNRMRWTGDWRGWAGPETHRQFFSPRVGSPRRWGLSRGRGNVKMTSPRS